MHASPSLLGPRQTLCGEQGGPFKNSCTPVRSNLTTPLALYENLSISVSKKASIQVWLFHTEPKKPTKQYHVKSDLADITGEMQDTPSHTSSSNFKNKAHYYLCLRVNFRLVLDKNLGNRNLVLLSCKVHWSEEILRTTVNISSSLQKQLCNVRVTFLGCKMQWCVTILRRTPTVSGYTTTVLTESCGAHQDSNELVTTESNKS